MPMVILDRALTLIEECTNYTPFKEVDGGMLAYLIQSETDKVLADINHETLPTDLESLVINRAVGHFLTMNAGKMVDGTDQVAKSITIGGTSVSLGGMSEEDRLSAIAQLLLNDGRDLACYRRLRW